MLKACSYCGKIHDSKFVCKEKEKRIKERQTYITEKSKKARYFHNSKKWQSKREQIKERDRYCCQICMRGLYQSERRFETENLSVHHIIPLAEDYEKRLDDYNLITLCSKHHELAEKGTITKKELFRITEEQEKSSDFPVCG